MNISEAATASSLSAKTIRYYEEIGLLPEAARAANGYRHYDRDSIVELSFIQRARDVGFSIEECKRLLSLYRNPSRESAHVKSLVLEKCEEIEKRIEKLHSTHKILKSLSEQCAGDEGPGCAIIDELTVPVQSAIDQM
jgi:MerR family transcriptional regulator, copper efflux regulator